MEGDSVELKAHTPDTNKVQADNIRINGKAWHLMKVNEECLELAAAITKYFTKGGDEVEIMKEAGDVEIALSNLRGIYGPKAIVIDIAKDAKIQRIAHKTEELERNGGSYGDDMLERMQEK